MFPRTLMLALLTPVLTAGMALAQELPDAPKPQGNVPPPKTAPAPAPPTEAPAPDTAAPPAADTQQPAAPSPAVSTVPAGSVPNAAGSDREKLFTLTKLVNFVMVPVSIKDTSGHLVAGLTHDNFSIYEDGRKQDVRFFTSDPFPISAAVLIDVGMADVALKKVVETFPSLVGAFSAYDEVGIYTYGNTVKMQQDYVAAQSDRVAIALRHAGEIPGRGSGPMIADSPMTAGASVNGRPVDPSQPVSPLTRNMRYDEPSRVLNDAILRAALDLSRRDRARRRIIFILSDGREQGSIASYSDVLKVLLSNEVSVYAIAVDVSAIPGYNKLAKVRLPRQGYSNVLPKYAAATGGEVFAELAQASIEKAYANVTEVSRNQYTIGYNAASTASAGYRGIEVRVNRPGLKVYARDGYYPLPPARKPTDTPNP